MQCEGSRLLSCPCGVVLLWPGRYAGCCTRDTTPPSPKGQQPASRRTGHTVPTSRAPMQKGVPDLWSYPLSNSVDRDGSGLSIHARASPEPETTAGQPAPVSTKAPGARDCAGQPAPLRLQKLLEPETAQGNQLPCVYKSSLTCSLRATGPQGITGLPETAQGNQPPCVF